jgi:hypothetical protein
MNYIEQIIEEFDRFKQLIDDSSKDGIAFRSNLEQLHYSLERATLHPDKIAACSLQSAVLDYNQPQQVTNLLQNPRINADGTVHAADAPAVFKLDKIFITSNFEQVFSGIFEIIYQVRNILVHGNMNPGIDEHNTVKYCYQILWDLMR